MASPNCLFFIHVWAFRLSTPLPVSLSLGRLGNVAEPSPPVHRYILFCYEFLQLSYRFFWISAYKTTSAMCHRSVSSSFLTLDTFPLFSLPSGHDWYLRRDARWECWEYSPSHYIRGVFWKFIHFIRNFQSIYIKLFKIFPYDVMC